MAPTAHKAPKDWATSFPKLKAKYEAPGALDGVFNTKHPLTTYEPILTRGLTAVASGSPLQSQGTDGTLPVLKAAYKNSIQMTYDIQASKFVRAEASSKTGAKYWAKLYRGFYEDIRDTTARKQTLKWTWTANTKTVDVLTVPAGFTRAGQVDSLELQIALPTALRKGGTSGNWETKALHNLHFQQFKSGGTVLRNIVRHGVFGYKMDDTAGAQSMTLAQHRAQMTLVLKQAIAEAPGPALPSTGTAPAHYRVVFNSLLVPVRALLKADDLVLTKEQDKVVRAMRAHLKTSGTAGLLNPAPSTAPVVDLSQVFEDHTTIMTDLHRSKLNVMSFAYYVKWAVEDLAALGAVKTGAWKSTTEFVAMVDAVPDITDATKDFIKTSWPPVSTTKVTPAVLLPLLQKAASRVVTAYQTYQPTTFFQAASMFQSGGIPTADDTKYRLIVKALVHLTRASIVDMFGTMSTFKTHLLNTVQLQEQYLSILGATHLIHALVISGSPNGNALTDSDPKDQYTKPGGKTATHYRRFAIDAMHVKVQELLRAITFINCKSGADRTSIFGGHVYASMAIGHTTYGTSSEKRIINGVLLALHLDQLRQFVSAGDRRNIQKTINPSTFVTTAMTAALTALHGNFHAGLGQVLVAQDQDPLGTTTAAKAAGDGLQSLLVDFFCYRNAMLSSYTDLSALIDFGSTGMRGIKAVTNPNIGETMPDFVKITGVTAPAPITSRMYSKIHMASREYWTDLQLGDALVQDMAPRRAS